MARIDINAGQKPLWLRIEAMLGPAISAWIEVVLTVVFASVAAYLLGSTTPVRFVEDLSQDLRITLTAPPARTPMVIVKMDDPAIAAMRDASPCHCLSPVDKTWMAKLIADLDGKGVRAIALDYLIDAWRTPEELQAFRDMATHLKAPLIAVVDPQLKPGVDYPLVPGVIYTDARTLISDDYDGVVRRYDPHPGHMMSLAGGVARALGAKVPNAPFLLRFRRPQAEVSAENAGALAPSYSAAYVGALPASFFTGRVAFIGRTTRSAGPDSNTPKEDMHLTPLRFLPGNEAGTPGIEVNAHAVDQIVNGDTIQVADPITSAVLILVMALVGALLGRAAMSWWMSTLIILLGALGSASFALVVFSYWGVMGPVASPTLGFLLGFFVLSRLTAVRLTDERAFYANTLERYLSPSVINRIVDGSEPLKISAETREISVLISDLENFSVMVEETPPALFSEAINDYLGVLTECLWKHEALIDKLTGDGVVAIFSAPVRQADHAQRAVDCAKDIVAAAEAFRIKAAERGVRMGRTRIGVNSGEGLVGNFGGPRRFNYTAYGQVVVIAARLEAANKTTGTKVLIGPDTYRQLTDLDGVRDIGPLELKGVSHPVEGYGIGSV